MLKLIFSGFFFCAYLGSTEVDSFTIRDPLLRDGLTEMNALMQKYFDQALLKANKAGSCEPKVLEGALHKLTTGLFWSDIEVQIEHSKTIDKRHIPVCKSIYQDICLMEGIALYIAKLGFILRIGDLYIGSDKFGHFIDQGFDYFQKSSLKE